MHVDKKRTDYELDLLVLRGKSNRFYVAQSFETRSTVLPNEVRDLRPDLSRGLARALPSSRVELTAAVGSSPPTVALALVGEDDAILLRCPPEDHRAYRLHGVSKTEELAGTAAVISENCNFHT